MGELNFNIQPPQKKFGRALERESKKGMASLQGALNQFQTPALQTGLTTLLDVLGQQGRTDPKLMNRELLDIGRNTETLQRQAAGNAAMRGMSNSGVANAIQASIGSAGADREAMRVAQDSAMAEERKRQDVFNILSMLLGNPIGAAGLQREQSRHELQAQKSAALTSAIASVAGSAMPG